MDDGPEPVRIPITGEIDLHTFRPAEVAGLVDEYLAACRERGLTSARIVHGKGTGTLRETVHAVLRRSPLVASYRLGDETAGGWGATLVRLKPPSGEVPPHANAQVEM
jgi:DNA-nicking Smr family endonuclease